MADSREAGWTDLRRVAADREAGAAEIASRAAAAVAALPHSDLAEAVRALVRSHAPMAPLWHLGSAVLSAEDHAEATRAFAAQMVRERDAVASASSTVLRGPVVTHSYSSTLVASVAAAGGPALCARSEPGGEGAETAGRLQRRGISARLVDDREALRAASDAGTVVTGADAVGPGGVVNKVGTRALAEAARAGGGSSYAVAGGSKLLAFDLPAPDPFERIPMEAFTGVISEAGVLGAREVARAASAHPLHPALADLAAELR